MNKDLLLSQDRVRELFNYDPETGALTWRVPRGGVRAGAVAGTAHHSGYLHVMVYRVRYFVHRLAWLYVHGDWPTHQIDHINGNGFDNRIANLRDVTAVTNQQNRRTAQNGNKTGMLGVSLQHGRYRALIRVGGRQKVIGYFGSADAAHAAYLAEKRQLHMGNTL